MDEALADYEARRDGVSAVDYDDNLSEARFTPPRPRLLAMRAAVRNKPEEATRLVKARMGMIDRSSFFNPENLQRLLGAAL